MLSRCRLVLVLYLKSHYSDLLYTYNLCFTEVRPEAG
jgi:hypothetical protein